MIRSSKNWAQRLLGSRAARVLAAAVLLLSGISGTVPAWSQGAANDAVLRDKLSEAVADTESFGDRFDAEVWLQFNSARLERQVPDPAERLEILKHAHMEASRLELYPELVLAVIDIESNFDRFAISRVGAQGLMQVMRFWLKELDRPDINLTQIQPNLRMGCTILRHYLDMEDGNFRMALARYHGSYPKTYYADKVLDRLRRKWYRQ